jgi:hypothetical protein
MEDARNMDETSKYETPQITDHGDLTELTAGTSSTPAYADSLSYTATYNYSSHPA